MNSTPPPLPKKVSDRLHWGWKLLIGFAAAVLLASLTTLFTVRYRARAAADKERNKIIAAGEPVTLAELARWPKLVADGENAAFIYTNANAHLYDQDLTNTPFLKLPLRDGKGDGENLRRVIAMLATNEAVFKIISRDSGEKNARYPLDYKKGCLMQVTHLARLKHIVLLLKFKAVMEANVKNSAAAAQTVEWSLNAAHSLDDEPVLVSQLYRGTMIRIAVESLEPVLTRTSLSDGQLLRLQKKLTQAEGGNALEKSLIGERAMWDDAFLQIRHDPNKFKAISAANSQQFADPRAPGLQLIGGFEWDHAFFLETVKTNLELIKLDPPGYFAMRDFNKKCDSIALDKMFLLSSMILPRLSNLTTYDATMRASARAAISALAIERWRLAHNDTLPKTLDELVPDYLPEVLDDPFDGKPLRYKKSSAGYIVYSVGQDLQDDGGKSLASFPKKTGKGQSRNYDLTFTVER